MYKQVAGLTSKARESRVALHNVRTGVRRINFDVGDYVLRGVLKRERGRKTDVCWKGHFCVTACKSDFLFEVRHLLNVEKSVPPRYQAQAFPQPRLGGNRRSKGTHRLPRLELCVIDHIFDLRQRDDAVELRVFWKGI
jgi:hypothetical protein